MKRFLLAGVSLAVMGLINGAHAADTLPPMAAPYPCDPYKKYSCLDSYLGTDFFTRFINYYRLEWGKPSAPSDPKFRRRRNPRRRCPSPNGPMAARPAWA